jgi:hypothetical protein
MPIIPALERLRWEDGKFKATLGYTITYYLKKKKIIKQINKCRAKCSGSQL